MWIEDILESNLLKCPNCEKLSLDWLTWNCDKCWNIQPSGTSLLKGKTLETIEQLIEKKYLWKIGLVLGEENVSLDIHLIEEALSINNSQSIVQLKIWEIDYRFYLNYNIKTEYTWDYNEEWIRCLSRVFFSNIEKLEAWSWNNYNFKNSSNKEKIKHFIVREVLNNYKYNKHL